MRKKPRQESNRTYQGQSRKSEQMQEYLPSKEKPNSRGYRNRELNGSYSERRNRTRNYNQGRTGGDNTSNYHPDSRGYSGCFNCGLKNHNKDTCRYENRVR